MFIKAKKLMRLTMDMIWIHNHLTLIVCFTSYKKVGVNRTTENDEWMPLVQGAIELKVCVHSYAKVRLWCSNYGDSTIQTGSLTYLPLWKKCN